MDARVEYGAGKNAEWEAKFDDVRRNTEAARFCVYTLGLMNKKLSDKYTEQQRGTDVKREIASLRAICGSRGEDKYVPKSLLTQLCKWVTKAK